MKKLIILLGLTALYAQEATVKIIKDEDADRLADAYDNIKRMRVIVENAEKNFEVEKKKVVVKYKLTGEKWDDVNFSKDFKVAVPSMWRSGDGWGSYSFDGTNHTWEIKEASTDPCKTLPKFKVGEVWAPTCYIYDGQEWKLITPLTSETPIKSCGYYGGPACPENYTMPCPGRSNCTCVYIKKNDMWSLQLESCTDAAHINPVEPSLGNLTLHN